MAEQDYWAIAAPKMRLGCTRHDKLAYLRANVAFIPRAVNSAEVLLDSRGSEFVFYKAARPKAEVNQLTSWKVE